jgi:hypothetical protein
VSRFRASVPDDQVLGSADDTELVPAGSLQVAPDGDPTVTPGFRR